MGWVGGYRTSQQAIEPPGECRSVFAFWRDLAHRFDLAAQFPWATLEDLLDERVAGTGSSFAALAEIGGYPGTLSYRKYEQVGFATPSGKVELTSSVLAGLGFDPLPYYREGPALSAEFPLDLIMGVREDEYFQTGGRHVPQLRKRRPEPEAFLHPADAERLDVVDGDWVRVEVPHGGVHLRVAIRDSMPEGVVRAPHGWWKPELAQGRDSLSGAWLHADGLLCADDDDFLDREQGIPHLKGLPCRVVPLTVEEAETAGLEAAAV